MPAWPNVFHGLDSWTELETAFTKLFRHYSGPETPLSSYRCWYSSSLQVIKASCTLINYDTHVLAVIKPDRSYYFSVDVFLSISVRAGVMNQLIFIAPITPQVLPTCCKYLLVYHSSPNTSAKTAKENIYAKIITSIRFLSLCIISLF